MNLLNFDISRKEGRKEQMLLCQQELYAGQGITKWNSSSTP